MEKNFKGEILKRFELTNRRKSALEIELANLEIEIQHLEPLARLYGSDGYFDTIEEERRVTEGLLKTTSPITIPGNRTGQTRYKEYYEAIWSGTSKNSFIEEKTIIGEIQNFDDSISSNAITSALYRGVVNGTFEKILDGKNRKYKYVGVVSDAGNDIHQE